MMADIVVQPCPFCGFHDVQLDEIDAKCFAVICPECECIGPVSRIDIDEAIELWNNAHKIRQLLADRCEALTLNLHSNEKRMEEMARAARDAGNVDALRAFAQAVMEVWPMGDLDGGTLQDIAVAHGILKPETRHEPCGESCSCNEYADPYEWEDGVVCYRKTPLLNGMNVVIQGPPAGGPAGMESST